MATQSSVDQCGAYCDMNKNVPIQNIQIPKLGSLKQIFPGMEQQYRPILEDQRDIYNNRVYLYWQMHLATVMK